MKKIIYFIFLLLYAGLSILSIQCNLIFIPDTSGIKTSPSSYNQVLQTQDRISIYFDFSVNRISVEKIFKIEGNGNNVSGVISWSSNTMYFTPYPELSFGNRYVLDCAGSVKDSDGNRYSINYEIPFYYITDSVLPPALEVIEPSSGIDVPVLQTVQLRFTKDIDPTSFKEGFSINPDTEYTVTWTDNRNLTITPDEQWENLNLYTVRITTDTTDTTGLALTEDTEFTFFTNEDSINPAVDEILVCGNDWIAVPPFPEIIGTTLNQIGYKDVIKINFSEEMDQEKTLEAFTLTPSVTGTKTWVYDVNALEWFLVFIPETGYTMNTEYTLIIKNTAEDIYGNPSLGDYGNPFPGEPIRFNPSPLGIPILTVTSITGNGFAAAPPYSTDTSQGINIVAEECTFVITFSEDFISPDEKTATQQKINISFVLGEPAGSPSISSLAWLANNSIRITYTGFRPEALPNEYYYMLEIKGEENGIKNTEGSFLVEDVNQLLKSN